MQERRSATEKINKFGISIPYSATNFLEVGACVSLKLATKVFFKVKKVQKFNSYKK